MRMGVALVGAPCVAQRAVTDDMPVNRLRGDETLQITQFTGII